MTLAALLSACSSNQIDDSINRGNAADTAIINAGNDRPENNKPNKNSWDKTFTKAIKLPAQISIYIAEMIASDAAEKELAKFRSGQHDGTPTFYSVDSKGNKELFNGDYYQELTQHLIEQLGLWYGGKIPHDNGLFSQSNTFRVFSPSDAIWQFSDGIDMNDIIGTFTYYVRITTNNGIIHFQGTNKISLESYSGENYLRHGLVNNPDVGPFSSTTQIFEWQIEIPLEYRK